MVVCRLEYNDHLIGLICLDHTLQHHEWQAKELALVADFCRRFLGPLLYYSGQLQKASPDSHSQSGIFTQAELEAVRLAAQGLSYGEIAHVLGKSVRTIDNQLRNARFKVGARNQVELIKAFDLQSF